MAETTTGFYLSTGYKDVPGLVLRVDLLKLATQRFRTLEGGFTPSSWTTPP